MVELLVTRAGLTCDSGAPCNQRYVYDWSETGQLVRARRWDDAAVDPSYDLTFAYSGGQRVLKSSTDSVGEARHTLEVFSTLRVERTTFTDDDYDRTPANEALYLGSLGRVIYGAADLPGASAAQPRLFLQFGDHLGSTGITIDHATSEVVEKTTYDVNGNTESDYRPSPRWSAFREDYRFTGKEEDIEVGLTYFGARYFHANLRRWISPDPLTIHGWAADPNPYAYVGGQTTRAVDPWGLGSTGTGTADDPYIFDDDPISGIRPRTEDAGQRPDATGAQKVNPPGPRTLTDYVTHDGRGNYNNLPGGYHFHAGDVVPHLANVAPQMALHAAVDAVGVLVPQNPFDRIINAVTRQPSFTDQAFERSCSQATARRAVRNTRSLNPSRPLRRGTRLP